WYSYKGDRIGQGRENAKQYLADHPDTMLAIENDIRANGGMAEGNVNASGTEEEAA
ncbi:MAG: DNA recombination/repair protein RecA, partial [Alphaproteobacteria bacterium CG_4_10_14_0_8_um_filter_53_9]